MPSILISGPAGAGKSALARRERARLRKLGPVVVADFQAIHAAITLAERGEDGLFPIRDEDLLAITESTRQRLILQARDRGITVIATNSDGNPRRRRYLLELLGPDAVEKVIDPGRDVVSKRLARLDGTLSEECEKALSRWYDYVQP